MTVLSDLGPTIKKNLVLLDLPFNETSGVIANDNSGRANDLTIDGITFLNDVGEGDVFQFNGGLSYLSSSPSVPLSDKWVMSVRIFHDSFASGGSTDAGRLIFDGIFESNGRIKTGQGTGLGDGAFICAAGLISTATWYDLEVRKDAATMYTVSINGVPGVSTDGLLDLQTLSLVGSNNPGSSFPESFKGRMKNFKLERL